MRFQWPPSEEHAWTIQTIKKPKNQKNFFFPLQKHNHLLLGVRIQDISQPVTLFFPISEGKCFQLELKPEEWAMLPYPIESHAVDTVWQPLELNLENYTLDFAYYPWENRQFRMRALVDSEGHMVLAYRINKNGQTVTYLSPKDHTMLLPEDTYIIPPTNQINQKSIHLVSSQSRLQVKKAPEGRYFLL